MYCKDPEHQKSGRGSNEGRYRFGQDFSRTEDCDRMASNVNSDVQAPPRRNMVIHDNVSGLVSIRQALHTLLSFFTPSELQAHAHITHQVGQCLHTIHRLSTSFAALLW